VSRIYWLLLIAAAHGAAYAQPTRTTAPACTGTLDGHVVDATTHEPVAAATVRGGDALLATTDDAGRFQLTQLCPATSIVVERDDYKPAQRDVSAGSIEIALVTAGEVVEIHDKPPPPPPMQSTATIDGTALENTRGTSFTDVIDEVPGVSALRAATGVAKPIIRGQFGRRLLLLVDDVRHRAQEWGLEHAPEVDPFSADRIRVVRGAGGVRYGADAIGGVVLVDPPEPRREPGYNGEVHLIGASNGRGGTVAARLQSVLASLPQLSTQVEGSVKRLAAATTPDYALQNTGALEWNAAVAAVYRAHQAEYKLSYSHYAAQLGVCACLKVHNPDDFFSQAKAGRPIGADEFTSHFAIDRPYQKVAHDFALARGRWELDAGSLTSTLSFQHDHREEYEVVRNAADAGAQYRFRLFTGEADTELEHDPIHLNEHWHLRGAVGVTAVGQVHDYGGLHLIPDYSSIAAGAYAMERLVGHTVEVEVGARYDYLYRTASIETIDYQRLVRSGQLAMDACGSMIAPAKCTSRYRTFATTVGAAWRFAEPWSVKGELSIAQRAPNPDEQYLNGAAPTFPVLGLGKPDIGAETAYSSSLTLDYTADWLKGEASVFANQIDDYIYFAPAIGDDGLPIVDTTIRGAFPRFVTRPIDARFWGADGGIDIAPIPQLELGAQASLVRAKNVADGSYLVFVPADHYRGSLTVHAPAVGGFTDISAAATGTYVARQTRSDPAADFIPPPAAYFLLGAELSAETHIADQRVHVALQGTNLTNARYRDYTSLMRYFADGPGWQVWFRTSVFFDSTKKGK
jgi:iron complex outermembrane receptor protein